jgi:CheY-like chemotaxis protein
VNPPPWDRRDEQHLDAWQPQVVLQDLLLPGGMSGIDATRRILARAPGRPATSAKTPSGDATRGGARGRTRHDVYRSVDRAGYSQRGRA